VVKKERKKYDVSPIRGRMCGGALVYEAIKMTNRDYKDKYGLQGKKDQRNAPFVREGSLMTESESVASHNEKRG